MKYRKLTENYMFNVMFNNVTFLRVNLNGSALAKFEKSKVTRQ